METYIYVDDEPIVPPLMSSDPSGLSGSIIRRQ